MGVEDILVGAVTSGTNVSDCISKRTQRTTCRVVIGNKAKYSHAKSLAA